jgi:hypothetical protein
VERVPVEPSRSHRLVASVLDAITRSDKERYVSLYAPDGVIHDPVGRTAFDPTGWVIAATCLRSTGCSCTARSTSSALSDNNIR